VTADGQSAERFVVTARDGSPVPFELAVPGKLRRVYRGRLTLTAHNGVLLAVVSMDRETAVASIVAAEMPASAPLEALKAQAVVARSFLVAGGRHVGYDFCDTTHCQFLRSRPLSVRRLPAPPKPRVDWCSLIAASHWQPCTPAAAAGKPAVCAK